MPQFHAHSETLTLLINRLGPLDTGGERTIALHSRAEYDAIPRQWHFSYHGALFRLKEKRWSSDPGRGTATFHLW